MESHPNLRAVQDALDAAGAPDHDLFRALTDRFARLGGLDLDLPDRATRPRAADLPE